MKRLYLEPLQFSEGGADGASGAEGTAEAQETAQAQEGEAQNPEEKTEEVPKEDAPKADLKKLLKENEELKAQYDKAVQNQIIRRFKDYDGLKAKVADLDMLSGLIMSAFPDAPQDGDPASLVAYLQNKTDLYAEAASQAGMTVDAYRRMQEVEAKNRALLGEQRAAQEEAQRRELYARWDAQIPEVKEAYPDFDEAEEMGNEETGERFISLISQGWTMKQAYEAIHMHEIMDRQSQLAKKQAAMETARQIKTGQGDVKESATGRTALSPVNGDISKMSDKEIAEIVNRVNRGDHVIL